MRKILFSLIGLAFLSSSLFAQKMHTAVELSEIIGKSKVIYQIEKLEKPVPLPDRSGKLNSNDFCRIKKGELFQVFRYELNKSANEYYEKGEADLTAQNYQAALQSFLKAYENDSVSSKIMTGIAKVNLFENNNEKAVQWLQKAISYNFIDFEAHRFLAKAYIKRKDIDNAVIEITTSHLLNRNNPDIIKEMVEIFKKKNINYSNWGFNPQCVIDKIEENKISISSHNSWLGFALFKAAWLYEPGYAESMGVKGKRLAFIQEKELLQGLLNNLSEDNLKNFPELNALNNALNYKIVNEFIFYEMKLPDDPSLVYLLTEDFIRAMRDYIIYIRCKS